jgi:hypothetical protein
MVTSTLRIQGGSCVSTLPQYQSPSDRVIRENIIGDQMILSVCYTDEGIRAVSSEGILLYSEEGDLIASKDFGNEALASLVDTRELLVVALGDYEKTESYRLERIEPDLSASASVTMTEEPRKLLADGPDIYLYSYEGLTAFDESMNVLHRWDVSGARAIAVKRGSVYYANRDQILCLTDKDAS